MNFKLPELPFEPDSLNPHISPETIEFHYRKHHLSYINRLNELLLRSPFRGRTLEDIIHCTQVREIAIFDNASQAWNHTFYWHGLSSGGARFPTGPLYERILRDFGTFEGFKLEFIETALSLFGSGWVWLVKNQSGRLEIVCSSNSDTPLIDHKIPILVCDLWEHAYYIDYRNAKKSYLEHFWKIVNWKFAASNFLQNTTPNMTEHMSEGSVISKVRNIREIPHFYNLKKEAFL